jgi:hypothetical protein
MMAHLKMQDHRYLDAIDMSINCSDRGIVFSEHAIDLCNALETKMPATEILKLIKRMEIEVSQTQKDVKKTCARFIDVRGQLIKVRTVIDWVHRLGLIPGLGVGAHSSTQGSHQAR